MANADKSDVARLVAGRRRIDIKTLSGKIRIPENRMLVRATVPIIGEAIGRDFLSYEVALAPGWNPSSFTLLNQSFSEVFDDFEFPPGQQTV